MKTVGELSESIMSNIAQRGPALSVPENMETSAIQRAQQRGVIVERPDMLRPLPPKVTESMLHVAKFARARGKCQNALQTSHVASLQVIGGDTGVGKSFALCWYVIHCYPGSAAYCNAKDLCDTPHDRDNAKLWATWRDVVLLAIDETGLERSPDVVSQLVHHRMDKGLHTVCATNLGRDDWEGRYMDERLLDRVTGSIRRIGLPDGGWYASSHGESLRASDGWDPGRE